MITNLFSINIVPRHSYRPETVYHDSKNRDMVCSLWLCTRTLPRFKITAHSLHAQTNTNALYCRTVSSNNLNINVIENPTYRLAPTLLAYGNSRFCISNLQNRIMSAICKPPFALQALILVNHDNFIFQFYCC